MLSATFSWRQPLVLLGAGGGRRLGVEGGGRPKLLLPLAQEDHGAQQTVLDHLLQTWSPWTSAVWVVGAASTPLLRDVLRRQGLPSKIVVQPEPDGTLNALMTLADRLSDRFTVVLGDCLVGGHMFGASQPFRGVGVWEDADPDAIRRNYSVTVHGDQVVAVEEKPEDVSGVLCGIGVYFLDYGFLDVVREMPTNREGRREMTDALSFFLAQGGELRVARFRGDYVNINTAADLRCARRLFGSR